MSLRFLTAGESHGPALTVIVEGLPAGVPFDRARIERDLFRRQGGYGRGARMKIESDCVEVLGGIRFGKTLGSPVSLVIRNKDHANWLEPMSIEGDHPGDKKASAVARPRPGHADLAGGLKYNTLDVRDILELGVALVLCDRRGLTKHFRLEPAAPAVGAANKFQAAVVGRCFVQGDPEGQYLPAADGPVGLVIVPACPLPHGRLFNEQLIVEQVDFVAGEKLLCDSG
jgi:hypothetical protein